MKTKIFSLLRFSIPLLFVGLLCLDACRGHKEEKKEKPEPPAKKIDYTFSGTVKSTKGSAIAEAAVSVNGKEARTDKEGRFSVVADSSRRFVVSVKKRGFGSISKIFRNPMKDYNYQMQQAFTVTIDPRKTNVIKDLLSKEVCIGSTSFRNLQFDAEYKKIPFVYDSKGNLIDFGWTPGLKPVFDYLAGPPVCNPGATVTLPANSIVNKKGERIKTPVTLAITTIDLLSPDGMPGDYTFVSEKRTGVMISMGAVSIELYSGEESYNLSRKSGTKISVPVDPAKMKFNKNIPETIPVLYYDDTLGVWKQEHNQMARLNKKTKSYEADVNHFSAINLDIFQPGGETCYTFRQDALSGGAIVDPFQIYGLTPGVQFTLHHGDENAPDCMKKNGTNFHFLYYGPQPGSEVCIILTNNSASPNAFNGISIVTAGQAYSQTVGDHNYVDIFGCPCTGTSGPCYNGTECNESTPGCLIDATTSKPLCTPVPIFQFNPTLHDAIAAGINLTPLAANKNLRIRWIFQTAPAAATFQYAVNYQDAIGGTITRIPAAPGTWLPPANYPVPPFNAANPPYVEYNITGIANNGQTNVWVTIHDPLSSDKDSNKALTEN